MPDFIRFGVPPHLYELKVYTCFNQRVALGRGSAAKGGAPSTAEGHVYAFGCTEEDLRKLVYGLKQIGAPDDDTYDRTTGLSFVAAANGQYAAEM